MATLIFKAEDVRRVVTHALKATSHSPEVVDYDKDFNAITKPGKPAVLLVHDDGVYLMSNGEPRDIVEGERSFVAYAKGCDPKRDADCWDNSRDLVGGDDFGETLPWAGEIAQLILDGEREIKIVVGKNKLELRYPAKKKVAANGGK